VLATDGSSRRRHEATAGDDPADQPAYLDGVRQKVGTGGTASGVVRRTSWPTEAGCQADQAADQARTDNGSQETVSKARTRAVIARRSPFWRVLLLWFQRCRAMA
jgi:hypothetical protein